MSEQKQSQLSPEQLRAREQELRHQLLTTRFDRAAGRLLNTAICGRHRKELSRVLTRLGELSRQETAKQKELL